MNEIKEEAGNINFIKENFELVEDKPGYVWFSKRNFQIVKEECISKAYYESRLKTDMIAMLTEIQTEIERIVKEEEPIDKKWANGLRYSKKIIQQKINSLKEVKDEKFNTNYKNL